MTNLDPELVRLVAENRALRSDAKRIAEAARMTVAESRAVRAEVREAVQAIRRQRVALGKS